MGKVYPAPFDVVLSDFDVVQPDLILYALSGANLPNREDRPNSVGILLLLTHGKNHAPILFPALMAAPQRGHSV